MKKNFKLLSLTFLLIFLISSCQEPKKIKEKHWQFISARDNGLSFDRPFVYRAIAPTNWIRKNPKNDESIQDTRKANCEFYLLNEEKEKGMRLTIHTFPIQNLQLSISNEAQIARWKQQFSYLNPLSIKVTSLSRGGFNGLAFEAEGIIDDKQTMVIAWSMKLAPLYSHLLQQTREVKQELLADYTIKVVGDPEFMKTNRLDIIEFAKSFELIEELPNPL